MSLSTFRTKVQDQWRRPPIEPLLPIEKKLIGWSLTIGLVALLGLAAINHYIPTSF